MHGPISAMLVFGLVLGLFISLAVAKSSRQADARSGRENHGHGHLPSADNVKLIFVGFRHGNRNPAQFLKGDTSHEEWAWQGASQLTNIGKQQAYSLGQFLRKRYGKVVKDQFYPSQVKAYSSSAERCQQTLQSVMAGFFPTVGKTKWTSSLDWQPIPYEINDPLLRMYNVKDCKGYTRSYQAISDDNADAARDWLNKDTALTRYISQNSGLNASLSDLADVADNIGNMKMMNVPLPKWVTNPSLSGYPPKSMYDDVMSFAEAHQILCADDAGCSRMMSGLWLDQILTTLQQTKDGKLKDRTGNFYGAHTETVLSLIRLLKAEDVKDCPTSAGLILEYTDVPQPAVRFIFHEPDPANPNKRLAEWKELPYCAGREWCPLSTFISAVKQPAFSDWQGACLLPKCAQP